MEQSWRFRPLQGNICPTCSTSHFPFCPHPPLFDQSDFGGEGLRRFPLENDRPFHRPFFDPFLDNRGSPGISRPLSHFNGHPNSMMPVPGHPNDAFGNSQPWPKYQNHNSDRDSFRQFPLPSQFTESVLMNGVPRDGFHPPPYDYGGNEFMRGEFVENDRIHKRTKVDEMSASSFIQGPPPVRNEYYPKQSRISAEDERRLNLIRDHGGSPSVAQPKGVLGTGSGLGPGTNEYFHKDPLRDRSFNSVDSGACAKFHDWPPKHASNMGVNGCRDSGFGPTDREGALLHPEHGLDTRNHSMQGIAYDEKGFHTGEHRNGFRSDVEYGFPQNRERGTNNEFTDTQNEHSMHSRYGQTENSLHHSLQSYGPRNISPVAPDYIDLTRYYQEPLALHEEEVYQHKKGEFNQQPQIPHQMPYPTSQGSHETFSNRDLQRNQLNKFMLSKEPQYPQAASWQVPSGSNMPQHEQGSNIPVESYASNTQNSHSYALQNRNENKHNLRDASQPFEAKPPPPADAQGSVGSQLFPVVEQFSSQNVNRQGGYSSFSTVNDVASTVQVSSSRAFGTHPPLPPLPPPPLPVEPPGPPPPHVEVTTSPSKISSSIFPVPTNASATVPLSLHQPAPEVQPLAQAYFHNKQHFHSSTGFIMEGSQVIHQPSSKQYLDEGRPFPVKQPSPDKPKAVDASCLFRKPHRATRPDHIVIILRGLPGSGKSYLAKMLRDLEVENGGDAPRIHSMDDYFMTEVEKVEESEGSTSGKGKKRITKKVMEYCYEPEMEEAYRSSMLKAFKKTVEEGMFTFIIVDDRNLRVADFAQFWAIAKRSGYEVFLLEATYKDPMGCAARNVHGFTAYDIQKMADRWEEAPPLYLQLDIQSLFHGDDLNESGIQEVDMDTEEVPCDEGLTGLQQREFQKIIESSGVDRGPDGWREVG
ncbi:PREDICTED: uncharacterized protein LOC104596878 isoform X2 [Nelumbo nucifera]|uniref:Uncharacterized protein LOC104596878 isoform X2 n=1 Tax=Nelumbo nucifera TaxID=4432 RepID=A0A1U7ZQN5_NELNU|nr:PREDICTED: uncharacterized protein LOC104596878 isoform X2 [Nelumbo nucifera]